MIITQPNNYYLPAEHKKQRAIMLTWPNEQNPWVEFNTIEAILAEIAYHIALSQSVWITYTKRSQHNSIVSTLNKRGVNLKQVFLYEEESDDIWIRDYGPLIVHKNKQLHLLNFQFNGWGNKYPFAKDNKLVEKLHRKTILGNLTIENVDMVLEGGSIDVDGSGLLLTTRRCLLNKNRNPQLTEQEIEKRLKKYLGITQILWLDHGYLEGDDTDGHIDTLARFAHHTIVYTQCTDKKDIHFSELNTMEKQLKNWVTCQKKTYQLVPLPWPKPLYSKVDGRRLPASYANFLITNRAVLVPTYSDPVDNIALERLGLCFPQRKIIPINSLPILEGGGSLHCITMQIPMVYA
jgi:agmatine deiminase